MKHGSSIVGFDAAGVATGTSVTNGTEHGKIAFGNGVQPVDVDFSHTEMPPWKTMERCLAGE